MPGALRPCAPSGSAVETKKAEREKEDVGLTCSTTVHLQRFIPGKAHGSFGSWFPL